MVLLSPSLGGDKGGEDTSSGIASEEGSGREDIGIERRTRDAGGAGDFVGEVRRKPTGGEGGREWGAGGIGGVLSTTTQGGLFQV